MAGLATGSETLNPIVFFNELNQQFLGSVQVICVGLLILTVILLPLDFAYGFRKRRRLKYLLPVALALWGAAVPCWFLYEYTYLFLPSYRVESKTFEFYKYQQDLLSKAWLAGLAMVGLYLKESRDTKAPSGSVSS